MTEPGSWLAFYQSDLQSVWGLWVAPVLFGLFLLALRLGGRGQPSAGATPAAANFVAAFTAVFLLETLLDPLATGPITRALGLADALGGSAIAFAFVYLGDFRVYLLLFGVAALAAGQPVPLGRAALWTLAVPALAGSVYAGALALWGDVAMGWLWAAYELSFFVVMLGFRARWVPAQASEADASTRNFLAFVCLYAASYYLLWLTADLLTLLGGFDAGWALRIVPNQLYYSFFIPLAWWRFFSPAFAAR